MSLVPRGSFYNMDKFFDDFFTPFRREVPSVGDFFAPRVDVKELDNHYEISAELPGVKKENVNVTLEDGVLTIEAECRDETKEEKGGKVIRQERRYGKYSRSFTLGTDVKEKDIKANFKDGILTVTAPKAVQAPAEQRRIEVK